MRSLTMAVLVLTAAALGCGGGGGSSGDEPSLVYVGNEAAVVLTRANAKDFAGLAFGSGDTGGAILPRFAEAEGAGAEGPDWVRWASLDLPGGLTDALATSAGAARRAARIPVDETIPCDSGFMSIKGSLADDGTGTLAIVYEECRTGEETVDGTGSFEIHALDLGTFAITDATIRFDLLTVTSPQLSQSAGGAMRMQVQQAAGAETLTMDMVMKDNLTGRMGKFDNLVFVTTYDDPFSPSSYTASVTGRIYDSVDGFADLSTASPLGYAFLDAPYPSAGGPLELAGAQGAVLSVAPASETEVRLTLDLDGDGLLEYAVRAPWASLEQDAAGTAPVAEAGADRVAEAAMEVDLDGTESSDADGDLLAYSWALLSNPEGSSAAVEDSARPRARFTPDLVGTYVVRVTVDDGVLTATDTVTVSVQPPVARLSFRVLDAEYSGALGRIVAVATNPDALHLYDPVTGADTAVALGRPPTAVSVGPGGLHAAVGHEGWVSHVDLVEGTVAEHPVSADVLDVVLAGNGFAYVFPRVDQWTYIRCLDLTTGAETLHTGETIYAGTLAKLHPNGTAIYGADNGLSPSDIEKYSIAAGTAEFLWDSPYHGEYAMCGNLWIAQDGARVFTRCGGVFSSSEDRTQDMLHEADLFESTRVESLADSAAAGKVFAVPAERVSGDGADRELLVFEAGSLSLTRRVPLTPFSVAGQQYPSHGRFVFADGTGARVFVVVQADQVSGLAEDYGVIVVEDL